MQYYYTGYISTAITKFDYKIFPDKTAIEVYLPAHDTWIAYTNVDKTYLEDYYFNSLYAINILYLVVLIFQSNTLRH
jgi:arginine-tRNA-protein transferase